MRSLYPTSFDSLRAWATENNVSVVEARVRFAQYAVLRAVSASRKLSTILVLKGGNALDFVWQPNRSTRDLDFSIDMFAHNATSDIAQLEEQLAAALRIATRILGVTFRVHSMEQRPAGPGKTFITYTARIGYALPDEIGLRQRIEAGKPSLQVISMEISLNEPVCADEYVDISGPNPLRVSTIEDIVAEKLRALLQQTIRNRTRRQDLLDIAVILRMHPQLDRVHVAKFLQKKAEARNVYASRGAFHHAEIALRAKQDYDALQTTTRTIFIEFEDALQALYELVDSLEIPEM